MRWHGLSLVVAGKFAQERGSIKEELSRMAFPYRRILLPIEFDHTGPAVLEAATRIANETGGTLFLVHVVPMVIAPTGLPNYVDIYKEQEQVARKKLESML